MYGIEGFSFGNWKESLGKIFKSACVFVSEYCKTGLQHQYVRKIADIYNVRRA